MRRLILALVLVCIAAPVFCGTADGAQKPAKIKVLLITGADVGVHPWREMSETTREILVKTNRFDVKVSEDPHILESAAALERYDVIAFLIYTKPAIPAEGLENLLDFVKGGKGLFVQHLASASFAEWDGFDKLCGRKWVMGKSGHGPRSVFKSNIVNKEHPVTKGLGDFDTDDELYAKLQGTGKINILVTADSDWSNKAEPLVFTSKYGKGRVIYNAYGHDRQALMTPNVQKIIARGVEWAATGKVK